MTPAHESSVAINAIDSRSRRESPRPFAGNSPTTDREPKGRSPRGRADALQLQAKHYMKVDGKMEPIRR